jgi:hypothetical protein
MTTQQYLAALKKLGLTPASKATAAALGVSVRQIQRYSVGEPIPRYVEMLLQFYADSRGNEPDWKSSSDYALKDKFKPGN